MGDSPCPRCAAPRAPGPECPRCGVVYARARAEAARESRTDTLDPTPARPPSAAALFAHQRSLEEARLEVWLARLAVPAALVIAWALVKMDLGRFLLRTFFGMWLHELGHAVAAWFCGYPAFPGPWFTPVMDERSWLFALAIMGGLGFAAWRARANGGHVAAAVALGVLVVQLACTLVLSENAAGMLIIFSGGAGSLVFGAALMSAFFVPPHHKLHRDWLRWGFLVIGAAGFVDTFEEWWTARTDLSVVGIGDEIEGVGFTDTTRLMETYGWTARAMVSRYFGLGVLCLLILGILQFFQVRRTREALAALEAEIAPHQRSA